ncbi:MAG: ATP-binding protein [Anaerolineales bacterium]
MDSIRSAFTRLIRKPMRRAVDWLDDYARRHPAIYSLRTKLVAPYAILTVIIAMLGIYVITSLVSSSFQERFDNQLDEASTVAADGIVRMERKHLSVARLMANMQGVAGYIEQGDSGSLQAIMGGIALNDEVELMAVLDTSGKALLTMHYNPAQADLVYYPGDDFSRFHPVQNVMQGRVDDQGDKYIGLLETRFGPSIFTSAPVFDPSGELAGILLVGSRVESLIVDLEQQALADIIVLDPSGELLATTLVEPEGGFGTLELGPLTDQGSGFQSVSRKLELYGRDYEIQYAPLILRNEPAGYLGAVMRSDYIINTLSTSRTSFSVIFTLGTVAVIVLGYILAQHIARPILRLRAISQAVAGGDLEQSSGLQRSDEIGELANAFDIMTLRLRERTEEAARLYIETVNRNKELAEINARLQAAQAQLVQSEKLAAVGQLTAGIVHDVKNPLAVIKGLAEELAEEIDGDEFAEQGLQTIRDSATRANVIVTDLLKFARQSTPELQRRDLRDMLESVFRLTEYLLRKGKVTLELSMPDRPVMAQYDSQQIEQVLINLVTNAVQAMPDGGTLHVSLSATDGQAVIKIRDTGIGILPEHLPRIFDPFFTTKPEGEGTGLGLSVSYGIITEHGGKIEVESEPGEGTTFQITLPTRELGTQEDMEPAEEHAAHSGR